MQKDKIKKYVEDLPVVTINVDLKNMEGFKESVRRYESTEQALKHTADKISHGIKVTRQGSIILDTDNMNPQGIQINESKIEKVLKRAEMSKMRKEELKKQQ